MHQLRGGVAIIGLGVIGGSLARALVRLGVVVTGWAESDDDRRLAASAGVRVPTGGHAGARSAAERSETIVLAVPLARVDLVAAQLLDALHADAVVLHTAGLQRRQALGFDDVIADRVIGTHPIAGSERAGFAASSPELFAGATVSIEARATAPVRERAEALWRLAGAGRFVYRPAEDHDRLMAWVSHLPQLAATALAATLAGGDVVPDDAGRGARDTTRLAESPLALWADILGAAPPDTTAALRQLRAELERLERAIAKGDAAAIARSWDAASAWRRAAEGRR